MAICVAHVSTLDFEIFPQAATYEVLLVRLACLFDPDSNTMLFACGKLYKRLPSNMANSAGFLLDSMFDFAERFNKLNLNDDELGIFSAVVLLSPGKIQDLKEIPIADVMRAVVYLMGHLVSWQQEGQTYILAAAWEGVRY